MTFAVTYILILLAMAACAPAAPQSREQAIGIVRQIQRADYEGDRGALQRLYRELSLQAGDKHLAARILYWRGFALWRRAINGFNDKVDPNELQQDLTQARAEFDQALANDATFVDAKIGALSCVSLLGYSINQGPKDPGRIEELRAEARQLRKDAESMSPGNPRLLWVFGPNLWYVPVERGGGQAKAMELYEQGLQTIRKQKPAEDALEPSWGEPELLMNLAWSYLSRTAPDVNAAEQNARAALQLVPYWHYVRDILLPQIQEAKKKQN
jgi:hypothetical protein